MKQKVVIRLQMEDAKRRSEALKLVVGCLGVSSAAIAGADQDRIEVTGDGVDAVELTKKLRKKLGFTELVSVAALKEKEREGGEGEGDGKPGPHGRPGYWPAPHYYYYVDDARHDVSCCIM